MGSANSDKIAFLKECLALTQEVTHILLRDTKLALERHYSSPTSLNPSIPPASWESMIWGRIALRTFASWTDAIASTMCRCALAGCRRRYLQLSNGDFNKLQKYNTRNRGPRERIKLGYKFYPRLFDVEFHLDLGGSAWRDFDLIVNARNAATHPERLEDFLPLQELEILPEAMEWYLLQDHGLLQKCAAKIGMAVDDLPQSTTQHAPRRQQPTPPVPYEDIASDAMRSLDLHATILNILNRDVNYHLDWLRAQFATNADSDVLSFALRTSVISCCSLAEGTRASVTRFLESAAFRQAIHFPRGLRRKIRKATRTRDRAELIAAWLEAQSALYGEHYRASRGEDWRSFKHLWPLRDRFVHPRSTTDLTTGTTEQVILIGALGWLGKEINTTLRLDPAKWAQSR